MLKLINCAITIPIIKPITNAIKNKTSHKT